MTLENKIIQAAFKKAEKAPETFDPETSGCYGTVYELDERRVVKHYRTHDKRCEFQYLRNLGNAIWEWVVAKHLESYGFPVPEMQGIIIDAETDLREECPKDGHIFTVMEMIPTLPWSSLSLEHLKELESDYKENNEEIRALGIEPSHDNKFCVWPHLDEPIANNVLYHRDEDQLYFIDFVQWRVTDDCEMNERELARQHPPEIYSRDGKRHIWWESTIV